ncbi:sugar dehydrogenase complex small subunit [Gluconacetobacter sacchari]|uniref:Dehydrogenase n=2 Tax=Gluconacetobacter sacchari TaxID=92759 RepID=A0A7W4NSL8_9PROT|nr:sugar dehydrogenase complex small subunit [Gluconacetobacter sacchari]MBB2161325.1 dehydrogenase [Gluconacetobacter sacchari]
MRGPVSRRHMLMLSAASAVGTLLPAIRPDAAEAAAGTTTGDVADFIGFSRFATGHSALDPLVGQSLLAALRAQNAQFPAQLAALVKTVADSKPADVEALEESLRDGPLHDTLLRIVRAWYSGVIEDGTNAQVYAYENALMYQPARDVVVIPTYAHNGPNYWVAEPAPVEQMPQF